jgi:hypothetical protein
VVRPGLELTRPEVRVSLLSDADFGTGQFRSVTLKGTSMRMFGCFVVAAGLLTAAPAMAGPYGNGGGYTNIWSSAQGTSNSYGQASGFGTSAAGAAATASGGGGTNGFHGGGGVSAITSSQAGTSSNGSGYAQAQTSGYAGGTASGYGGHGH